MAAIGEKNVKKEEKSEVVALPSRMEAFRVFDHSSVHKIQSIMDKYCVLGIDYLAGGLSSVVKVKEKSSIESLFSFSRQEFFRASSAAKHSFISAASSLMFGLLTEAGDMQAIAISTAFQAEPVSNSPFNLVSTIFLTYVSPLVFCQIYLYQESYRSCWSS